ncbi:MAG: TonB-dependent receptor, partial [Bacteroidales bacterium]|nr:TonB-dependent receptor [Bacteroidales bacterium]
MKKFLLLTTALFFASFLQSQDIVGTWNGTLSVMGQNIRLVFHITKDGDVYKATMDSPDQGASGIAVNVTFEDNKIKMSVTAANAEYNGELKDNKITGNFKQMGFTMPLDLTRAGGEQSSGTTGFLRGRLFDSQTREALLFASVALLKISDSSLVTGTTTDVDGRFLLEKLRDGEYLLRITNIGYHTYVHPIELKRGNNRLDLGSFFINPSSTQLTGVEIVASRPVLEQHAGKLVFNVAESTTSVGDNALETLKKFPGVTVDNDDNISLNGNSSVLVMLDGRPTQMSGRQLADLLKSLPSSDIDRIEAIDNPPARYDAQGIGGILDIKTKRTRMMGYSGTVNAGFRYHRKFQHDEGFTFNFRSNKITTFANFSMSTNNSPAGMTGYTNFPNGSKWEQNKGANEKWSINSTNQFLSGRGGFDYYFNKRNIVSLSYRATDGRNGSTGNIRTRMYMPNNLNDPQTSFQQEFNVGNQWGNQNLNLNYQNIFDSANSRQFFVDASWVKNHSGGGGNSDILHYSGDIGSGTPRNEPLHQDVHLSSNIFSIKGDVEYPLNKETKIETGAKYSYVNNDNNQIYTVGGILYPEMTNQYIYTENISSLYGMINHRFSEKIRMEAGLRYEHTALEGYNKTINSTHTNSYWGLFPS